MDSLKNLLILVRWGSQVDRLDWHVAKEMTFLEVLRSSYLQPKTKRVLTDSLMRRR